MKCFSDFAKVLKKATFNKNNERFFNDLFYAVTDYNSEEDSINGDGLYDGHSGRSPEKGNAWCMDTVRQWTVPRHGQTTDAVDTDLPAR